MLVTSDAGSPHQPSIPLAPRVSPVRWRWARGSRAQYLGELAETSRTPTGHCLPLAAARASPPAASAPQRECFHRQLEQAEGGARCLLNRHNRSRRSPRINGKERSSTTIRSGGEVSVVSPVGRVAATATSDRFAWGRFLPHFAFALGGDARCCTRNARMTGGV